MQITDGYVKSAPIFCVPDAHIWNPFARLGVVESHFTTFLVLWQKCVPYVCPYVMLDFHNDIPSVVVITCERPFNEKKTSYLVSTTAICSLDSRKVCHFNNPQITCERTPPNNYQTFLLSLNGQFVASQAHCFWGGFYDDRLLLHTTSISLSRSARNKSSRPLE